MYTQVFRSNFHQNQFHFVSIIHKYFTFKTPPPPPAAKKRIVLGTVDY